MMVVVLCMALIPLFTSCGKDEVKPEIVEVEVHDTISVVDTVTIVTINYYDFSRTVEFFMNIGEEFEGWQDYQEYVRTHATSPVHEYLLWIGLRKSSYPNLSPFYYNIHADEYGYSVSNRETIVNFYDQIVVPIQLELKNYQDQTHCLDPNEFLASALKKYGGQDPYGYLLVLSEMAGKSGLFGAK